MRHRDSRLCQPSSHLPRCPRSASRSAEPGGCNRRAARHRRARSRTRQTGASAPPPGVARPRTPPRCRSGAPEPTLVARGQGWRRWALRLRQDAPGCESSCWLLCSMPRSRRRVCQPADPRAIPAPLPAPRAPPPSAHPPTHRRARPGAQLRISGRADRQPGYRAAGCAGRRSGSAGQRQQPRRS